MLTGMVELAEEVFHMPVRVGCPNGRRASRSRRTPFPTSIGLLLIGNRSDAKPPAGPKPETASVGGLFWPK